MEFPEISEGSNVIGVGIDQIEVYRIRESIDRHGDSFLAKVFSENEQAYCLEKADPAPHFAARFAAKEAAAKALGSGIGREFGWLDMEVVKEFNGQPTPVFSSHGMIALGKRGASLGLLSLSHLRDVASAVLVLVAK